MTTARRRAAFFKLASVVALGWALALGCVRHLPAAYVPDCQLPTRPAAPGKFMVGTARVDVTPPPGVTTFGHGPDALVSKGYWTRIYCRVFVLIGTAGPVALIPCDLRCVEHALAAIGRRARARTSCRRRASS